MKCRESGMEWSPGLSTVRIFRTAGRRNPRSQWGEDCQGIVTGLHNYCRERLVGWRVQRGKVATSAVRQSCRQVLDSLECIATVRRFLAIASKNGVPFFSRNAIVFL